MWTTIRRMLGSWKLWYGLGWCIWLGFCSLAYIMASYDTYITDVPVLPAKVMKVYIWLVVPGFLCLLASGQMLIRRYRPRIGISVVIVSLFVGMLIPELLGSAFFFVYDESYVEAGQRYHRVTSPFEHLIFVCHDDQLLSCDLVERYNLLIGPY